MEKNHKIICFSCFALSGLLTYIIDVDFSLIASETISVVSIALAIYTFSISTLVGSKFTKNLKENIHKEKSDYTQLDVLRIYFKNATTISIITIILSMFQKLNINIFLLKINKILSSYKFFTFIDLSRIFSSVCFAFLTLNFIFIWLIIKFVLNRQLLEK